jgi:ADP-dependent NAD(P)H-hydrate dehydratase
MSGTEVELVTAALLRDWSLPGASGSKQSRGRVVVAGGSRSTPGAVMLAGLAALRVGAGVLSLAVAEPVAAAVAAAVPEASVTALALAGDRPDPAVRPAVEGAHAVLVGPGLDAPEPAEQLLHDVLDGSDDDSVLVLDAFALGVLPNIDSGRIAGRAVLTPNSTEAARLISVDDVGERDPGEVAHAIAGEFDCVVSFQSHIAAPDGRHWTVPTGHPGLGTSGSGDVLAGAVTGLLARGTDAAQAACWATYLHATAGDRLAAHVGRLGFLARELVDQLPFVLVEMEA